jgi:hypothetical protein
MQGVQPTLDEYDVALDMALHARQDAISGSQADMFRSFAEQNPAVSLAILQRHVQLSVAVRSVNDRYIEALAQVMPEARSGEFRQKALERAYPRVYRSTPVQAIFTAAKELPGLSAETLQAIITLEAAFLSELTVMNEHLAAAMRDWEPKEMQLRAEAFARRMSNTQTDPIEDPTREPFQQRDEMQRRYVRQLQALLTPEQFGQLPGGYRWADNPGEERPAEADRGAGTKARKAPDGTQVPELAPGASPTDGQPRQQEPNPQEPPKPEPEAGS